MDALREGLAPDGGLYLPSEMPIRNNLFWESLHKLSFADIAFEMARPFLKGELSDQDLREIYSRSIRLSCENGRTEPAGVHIGVVSWTNSRFQGFWGQIHGSTLFKSRAASGRGDHDPHSHIRGYRECRCTRIL